MNETLIKHAENDVDGYQRREDQQWLGSQRILERLGVALECRDQRIGDVDIRLTLAIASTACPNAAPAARLNDSVMAGN
jgi:hypothetical protein